MLNEVPAPEGENAPAQAEVAADPPIIILPAAGGAVPPAAMRAHLHFCRRPTIDGILDFSLKRHKTFYEDGCKSAYIGYDCDADGRHAFVTALSFKATKFEWTNLGAGILDIPTDDPGHRYKNFLEYDGQFDRQFLQSYVQSFLHLHCRAAQDDAMLFSCAQDSLSSEGIAQIYAR